MNKDAAQKLIKESLATLLEIPAEQIEADVTFDRYGVDSFVAVNMTVEIGDAIGADLSPTLLYKYKTVAQLAEHVASISEDAAQLSN